MVSNNLS